jgi:surfeit locus 1 family protein
VVLQHSVEYKIGRYRLTINFWFLIIFLLVQTGLNELGFWQLSRAHEKQARLEKLVDNQLSELTSLKLVDQKVIDDFGKVQLEVVLAEKFNLLVENKIQNGELGYHVLNLVQDLDSGRNVLVNRGWIEGKADRNQLPQIKLPRTDWQVKGRVYQINKQVLSGDAELESHGKILRLPVLDLHMLSLLEKRFDISIEPYLLRLDENVTDSFAIDWAWVSMSPDKHLGYAFQWFGLSLAFLIISLFVLIKKESEKKD